MYLSLYDLQRELVNGMPIKIQSWHNSALLEVEVYMSKRVLNPNEPLGAYSTYKETCNSENNLIVIRAHFWQKVLHIHTLGGNYSTFYPSESALKLMVGSRTN